MPKSDMKDLFERIKELGGIHGVDLIGVAGIEGVREELREIGGEVLSGYPRAVSIGIALPGSVVDLLYDRSVYENVFQYKNHAYDVINTRLDIFASIVSSVIRQAGFDAMPIHAAERIDSERVCASVSHKAIARLAGFGWIGKNCLLVNPQFGPRMRWTTVLTDAPFEENRTVMENRCGGCMECTNACPAGAILGRNYAEGEPRELRLDVRKCEAYFEGMRSEGNLAVCGMCLYACPWGRK